MSQLIMGWALLAGKTAPDKSHKGIRKRFIIEWNPWVDSILHAKTKPKLVNEKLIKSIIKNDNPIISKVKVIPTKGAAQRKESLAKLTKSFLREYVLK